MKPYAGNHDERNANRRHWQLMARPSSINNAVAGDNRYGLTSRAMPRAWRWKWLRSSMHAKIACSCRMLRSLALPVRADNSVMLHRPRKCQRASQYNAREAAGEAGECRACLLPWRDAIRGGVAICRPGGRQRKSTRSGGGVCWYEIIRRRLRRRRRRQLTCRRTSYAVEGARGRAERSPRSEYAP